MKPIACSLSVGKHENQINEGHILVKSWFLMSSE